MFERRNITHINSITTQTAVFFCLSLGGSPPSKLIPRNLIIMDISGVCDSMIKDKTHAFHSQSTVVRYSSHVISFADDIYFEIEMLYVSDIKDLFIFHLWPMC